MCHELWRCRQAGCTDADTELRRQGFLADLRRVTGFPVHRFQRLTICVAATAATATSTIHTWRATS